MNRNSKIINLTNKFIDSKNLSDLEKELVFEINNILYFNEIENEENELYEYFYRKLFEYGQYIELLINIYDFIKEKISIYNFVKFNFKPLSINFMEWFIDNSGELKRKLTFDEILNLDFKYNIAILMKKKFKSFKELYLIRI